MKKPLLTLLYILSIVLMLCLFILSAAVIAAGAGCLYVFIRQLAASMYWGWLAMSGSASVFFVCGGLLCIMGCKKLWKLTVRRLRERLRAASQA